MTNHHSTASAPATPGPCDDHPLERLRHLIEQAALLLPAQGPITAFVFDNPLSAYVAVPFEEALASGSKTFGCHPYWTEERYHRELARGRIHPDDLAIEIIEDLGDRADALLGFLGTRYHLRLAMLEQPLRLAPTRELEWLVTESDALRKFRDEVSPAIRDKLIGRTRHWITSEWHGHRGDGQPDRVREVLGPVLPAFDLAGASQWSDTIWTRFVLQALWQACLLGVRDAAPPIAARALPVRHRDLLLEASGRDSDALVHAMLIRFSAAFCDQGLAAWLLPTRDAGFLQGFLDLYETGSGGPEPWLCGLRAEIEAHFKNALTPLESIERSLRDLGVAHEEQEAYLSQSLLALRGWAGMLWQMETRGDRVAHPVARGTLVEFLAVRLVLERLALAHTAREAFDWRGSLGDLRAFLAGRIPEQPGLTTEQRAFQIFQLAQLRGWRPEFLCRLSLPEWTSLIDEVEAFSSIERRRIFHRAFERRYRVEALDAIAANCRMQTPLPHDTKPPPFQVIACLDDREESFRRHLEEIEPACETFGVAGFFGVAMYFRGVTDAYDAPLCPIVITPQHYVREHVALTFEGSERVRRHTRQAIGTVTHRFHVGSRTFMGGVVAAVIGSLASIPLVMRVLFPRTTAHLRTWFGGFVEPPPVTQLELERTEVIPGTEAGHIGFTVAEMAAIVERLLRDIGLTNRFARLVFVLGHGSSSLNNPHESAYKCGACAGASGGPNARAITEMANDSRVRDALARHGIVIPDTTRFIGGTHDTCNDSVRVDDLERLPSTHTPDFLRLRDVMNEARRRNAHERCRRFRSADLNLTAEAALRHVEARAEDLSQARPEFKNANALCLVGRRHWSRGLFLDRRAFLQSYDQAEDDEEFHILERILQAVVPVCSGINLQYYFSSVDPVGWGAGNKLSHNITSLVGVMDGAASDLRPGLHRQMVEIHEPIRLTFLIETTVAAIERIMDRNLGIKTLVRGRWIHLAIIDPTTGIMSVEGGGEFKPYTPEQTALAEARSSRDCYAGCRDNVRPVRINPNAVVSTRMIGASV